MERDIEKVIKEYEQYAHVHGFKLNSDKGAVEKIVRGLLENEQKYGKKYCPCRRVVGNEEEDRSKVCPCLWHKEELDKRGRCFCGLFEK